MSEMSENPTIVDDQTHDAPQNLADMSDAQIMALDAPEENAGVPQEGMDPSDGAAAENPEENDQAPAVDYEAFYQQVMQPVTVAGRKVEIKSPEEALRLMQMGADYTRKTQSIAPHRKALAVLEKHGLLAEEKLDFLVALDKKDPEAIKKYLADANIDPMTLDLQNASTYTAGQHVVPDVQIAFDDAVEQVRSTPEGRQFLAEMDNSLDSASKQVLFMNPDALPVLLAQRQSGVFDAIAHEVDRLRMLGHVPATMPFIEAYRTAGEAMRARGELGAPAVQAASSKANTTPLPQPQPQPQAALPQATTHARAQAAAPTRGRQVPAPSLDVQAAARMSDAQFMQHVASLV